MDTYVNNTDIILESQQQLSDLYEIAKSSVTCCESHELLYTIIDMLKTAKHLAKTVLEKKLMPKTMGKLDHSFDYAGEFAELTFRFKFFRDEKYPSESIMKWILSEISRSISEIVLHLL